MRILFLLFFSLLYACTLDAQYRITGYVFDEETDQPVPYVNIAAPDIGRGTVSNAEGFFMMDVDKADRIVRFSSIAYETSDFRASDLAFGKTVFLTPKSYALPEVKLTASRLGSRTIRLGLRNRSRGHSVGFGSRQLGTEIGSIIVVPKKYLVKSAHFVLNHAKGDSLLFRLNLYDYSNNTIGEKLIKEDIIVNTGQSKGQVDVDLSSYQLLIEDDIVMSLEWIEDDEGKGNNGISFDTKRGKRKHRGIFVKQTSGGEFKPMSYRQQLSLCFYLQANEVLD